MIEEPIQTSDDTEFTQGEIKQTIESFNGKKAQGIDRITSGISLLTFHKFHTLITAIYNQCQKGGYFPKCRPIGPINIGGKVLEKLLINRINHHMYKNELLINRQYGFMPQRSTTDAAMEAKKIIEPE